MATHSEPKVMAFEAEADLSTHQYKLVKFGSDETKVVLCGNGERAIGVLMNAPKSGEDAEVASFGGGAKVKAGGSISAGESVMSNASGLAVAATTGLFAFGISFETAVSGDLMAVEMQPHVIP